MSITPVRPVALPRRPVSARPAVQAAAAPKPRVAPAAPVQPKAAQPAGSSLVDRLKRVAFGAGAGGGIGMGLGALVCAGLSAFGVAGGLLAFHGFCLAGIAAGGVVGALRDK